MSKNYEHRRNSSLVNEGNANQQEDNRLAQALLKLDREKDRVGKEKGKLEKEKVWNRRQSEASINTNARTSYRRASFKDTVLLVQRRNSKQDFRTDANSSQSDSKPYTDLLDKDKFEKFMLAAKKLSLPAEADVKEEDTIDGLSSTEHRGDMNMYLRMNNDDKKKKVEKKEVKEDKEQGNINWSIHTAPVQKPKDSF